MEARVYLDHIEIWYWQEKVEELPRLRGRSKHRVDYRHIIEWPVRKPGAFENYRYTEGGPICLGPQKIWIKHPPVNGQRRRP